MIDVLEMRGLWQAANKSLRKYRDIGRKEVQSLITIALGPAFPAALDEIENLRSKNAALHKTNAVQAATINDAITELKRDRDALRAEVERLRKLEAALPKTADDVETKRFTSRS